MQALSGASHSPLGEREGSGASWEGRPGYPSRLSTAPASRRSHASAMG
jgi:hypothetical protein